MSCVFVVMPVVMVAGGFPLFCAAAASAAAALGYRKLAAGRKTATAALTEVEVVMESSRVIAETLAEDERVVVARDGIEAEFYKDPAGRFSVHVRGRGIAEKVLREEGKKLIGRIRQQYAYQRVTDELESRGFKVIAENLDQDQRIRIRLERMAT